MKSIATRKSLSRTTSTVIRKSRTENSQISMARKRRSLLLQHSISLHIPIGQESHCSGVNCYVSLPDKIFNLTYLSENDTNPESLEILEEFKQGKWQAYLLGFLYNFTYQPAQRHALERAINKAFQTKFQNSKSEMTYHSHVSRCEGLSPTENDSDALKITVTGRSEAKEQILYVGFLISWYSPIRESHPFLPILLCRGKATYQAQVHSVVSEKFDVLINRLTLSAEELMHLSTYCLIMLDERDGYHALFSYRISTGDVIKLEVAVEQLLKLWKKIHKSDSNEIDFDEVTLFHCALDEFYESIFGIKLGCAHFHSITVHSCFSLQANSEMWCKSTKVIHVLLKYLNYLAIKRLKVKVLNNYFDEGNMEIGDSSEVTCR